MSLIDTTIIEALKEGDERALEKIFYRYKDKLYAYCFKIVKTKDLTDEIVADVFITLWKRRDQLNITTSFEAYLITIARNLAIDSLKKASKDERLYEEILLNASLLYTQPEDRFDYYELQAAVEAAIDNLPPQRRQIFRMSREENYTHQEIADRLHISKNTVKDQIVKALADIRTYLRLKGHTEIPAVILYFLFHKK